MKAFVLMLSPTSTAASPTRMGRSRAGQCAMDKAARPSTHGFARPREIKRSRYSAAGAVATPLVSRTGDQVRPVRPVL